MYRYLYKRAHARERERERERMRKREGDRQTDYRQRENSLRCVRLEIRLPGFSFLSTIMHTVFPCIGTFLEQMPP